MTPEYPQFYLDGNIALQEVVDNFRDWTRRTVWEWLAFTCILFMWVLIGVVFENLALVIFGGVNLPICANTFHILLTLGKDYL